MSFSLKSSPSLSKFSLSSSLKNFFSNSKEITTEKNNKAPIFLESKYLEASMISGSLMKFVKLPKNVSRIEWLSSHGTITKIK